jgi:hypothetical protein
MTSAVMAEDIRLPDGGTRRAAGSGDDAPADRLLGLALRVLVALGALPLLVLLGALTGVAIPLCRLVAACERAVRPRARANPPSGRTFAPDASGPRR